MKIKQNFNYIIFVSTIIIVIYLLTIFLNIRYDPNHIPKSHHDYGISSFLIFFAYAFGWVMLLGALFLTKMYLNGKRYLIFITGILVAISQYTLFLLFVESEIETIIYSGRFRKAMVLVLPSMILLVLSHSKYLKKIHNESKIENSKNLN